MQLFRYASERQVVTYMFVKLRLFLVNGRNKMLEILGGEKNAGWHIANHKKKKNRKNEMEFLVRLHQELCAAGL